MAAQTIGFAVQERDLPELQRLVDKYGEGNRSEFLREAMKTMAARDRAERFQDLQARVHAQIGGPKTTEQVVADVRDVVKGR